MLAASRYYYVFLVFERSVAAGSSRSIREINARKQGGLRRTAEASSTMHSAEVVPGVRIGRGTTDGPVNAWECGKRHRRRAAIATPVRGIFPEGFPLDVLMVKCGEVPRSSVVSLTTSGAAILDSPPGLAWAVLG